MYKTIAIAIEGNAAPSIRPTYELLLKIVTISNTEIIKLSRATDIFNKRFLLYEKV